MIREPDQDLLDEQIDKALALAKEWEPYWPTAVQAKYVRKDDAFQITLSNGVQISLPRRLLQGLEDARPMQLHKVRITMLGEALRWPALDVDHYLPGLLNGVFGNRRWMAQIGRNGGRARTPAKARAARANGRKGGRPKKAAH